MTDTSKTLSRFFAADHGVSASTAVDPFADLRAAVALDADWREDAHPRESKGGEHGGQFAKKPETLAKEDSRDNLSKNEGADSLAASTARLVESAVKGAAPEGTSVKADVITERGRDFVAVRLVKNDRDRFSASELKKMKSAMEGAGCMNVEEDPDTGRENEVMLFGTPPVDATTAASSYMSEVEKEAGIRRGDYKPSDEAKESAREMAKNKDEKNPAKRIRVDFQEWTYEDGLKGEPSVVGKEYDATDGKVFDSPEAAAKWLLEQKNAGALEGDDAWFSSVTGKDGKWKTYRLTPVNFSEEEILDIDSIVSKGTKE